MKLIRSIIVNVITIFSLTTMSAYAATSLTGAGATFPAPVCFW